MQDLQPHGVLLNPSQDLIRSPGNLLACEPLETMHHIAYFDYVSHLLGPNFSLHLTDLEIEPQRIFHFPVYPNKQEPPRKAKFLLVCLPKITFSRNFGLLNRSLFIWSLFFVCEDVFLLLDRIEAVLRICVPGPCLSHQKCLTV